MNITSAIESLTLTAPRTLSEAEAFLNNLSQEVQEQVIDAIYIGRDHMHARVLTSTDFNKIRSSDLIQQSEYAKILVDKRDSVKLYLDKFVLCCANSGVSLNEWHYN